MVLPYTMTIASLFFFFSFALYELWTMDFLGLKCICLMVFVYFSQTFKLITLSL